MKDPVGVIFSQLDNIQELARQFDCWEDSSFCSEVRVFVEHIEEYLIVMKEALKELKG